MAVFVFIYCELLDRTQSWLGDEKQRTDVSLLSLTDLPHVAFKPP